MKDREFLQWLYERLIYVYGENPSIDYMHKLQAIIDALPAEQDTPTIGLQDT